MIADAHPKNLFFINCNSFAMVAGEIADHRRSSPMNYDLMKSRLQSFYHLYAHSKILQNAAKYRSILTLFSRSLLFRIAKRSIVAQRITVRHGWVLFCISPALWQTQEISVAPFSVASNQKDVILFTVCFR